MIELIEWDGLRLVVRGESVDREQVEWMTGSFFWAEFLESDVRSGDTVFDLGSHIGSFALRASASRQCYVWAAEPDIESATIHRINQDFRFGSSDGTSLHPHPAKRNHFSTRKRRRLRRDRSSPLLAPHGG